MDLTLHHPDFFAPDMRAAFYPVLADGNTTNESACTNNLAPEELALARRFTGKRRRQFAAGRMAASTLVNAPVLAEAEGAPLFPAPWTGSIAHTTEIAVAVCAPAGEWTVGVDMEQIAPERPSIARMILREDEPPVSAWEELLRVFCLKEALYKALYPHLRRYVDFKEALVRTNGDGSAEIIVALDCGRPFVAEGASLRISQWMLAWVRVRQ